MELVRDNVKVAWEAIGEGLCGDYNPKDPDDVEFLRFYVSVFRDGEWEEKENASYCTCFPVSSSQQEQMAGLMLLMDRFHEVLSGNIDASVKKLGEELSWISPDAVQSYLKKRSLTEQLETAQNKIRHGKNCIERYAVAIEAKR